MSNDLYSAMAALNVKFNSTTALVVRERYSLLFPLYSGADLVVRASDGVLFATRAIYLRAASSVLEDTLSIGSAHASEKKAGLPVLQLKENEKHVQLLLRLVQRDRHTVNGQALDLSFEYLCRASVLADKYDLSPVVQDLLFDHILPSFIGRAASMDILGLAWIHEREDVIRRAIKALHRFGAESIGSMVYWHHSKTWVYDWRYLSLGDLDDDLAERVPMAYLLQFAELHNQVLCGRTYTFIDAAYDWEVSLPGREALPDLTNFGRRY